MRLPTVPRLPYLPDPLRRSRTPDDIALVTDIGDEEDPAAAGMTQKGIDDIWDGVVDVYRGGAHPAMGLCVRRNGHVVLHRSIGYAHGNGPKDKPDTPKVRATTATPFLLYSASKAVTAMVVHLLAQRGEFSMSDRIVDFIPEFGRHGKGDITIGHVLSHRAGVPLHPSEVVNLEAVQDRAVILEALCDAKPQSKAGSLQAYHALSGGAIMGEVVQRVTGSNIHDVLAREICEPLGFRWGNYGVAEEDLQAVATNYVTGFPVLPPVSTMLTRLLGTSVNKAVEMSNDPRFLTAVVPGGNVVMTADELSRFYELLRRGGELDGVRIFEPETIEKAVVKQSYQRVDFTLGFPIGYSYGFMLGGKRLSLFGTDSENAYGHLGYTNVVGYSDPSRGLAVGFVTSGKPVVYPEAFGWLGVMGRIGMAAGKL